MHIFRLIYPCVILKEKNDLQYDSYMVEFGNSFPVLHKFIKLTNNFLLRRLFFVLI
jgi:hypothetical protein